MTKNHWFTSIHLCYNNMCGRVVAGEIRSCFGLQTLSITSMIINHISLRHHRFWNSEHYLESRNVEQINIVEHWLFTNLLDKPQLVGNTIVLPIPAISANNCWSIPSVRSTIYQHEWPNHGKSLIGLYHRSIYVLSICVVFSPRSTFAYLSRRHLYESPWWLPTSKVCDNIYVWFQR